MILINASQTRAAVECAAMLFARMHSAKQTATGYGPSSARALLRAPSVEVLRAIWKTGDASDRELVAARVAVWCERRHTLAAFMPKIIQREKARQQPDGLGPGAITVRIERR